MINSIDHLIVCVNDLEEAEENYTKLFGFNPVFRGEHIDLGTKNSIFNFKNTYLELLSSSGSGRGATFVNEALKKHGEGLAGMALNVNNVMDCLNYLRRKNYFVNEPIIGSEVNVDNSLNRKWKSLFLPPELSRGLFLFLIEHTEGLLGLADTFKDSSIDFVAHANPQKLSDLSLLELFSKTSIVVLLVLKNNILFFQCSITLSRDSLILKTSLYTFIKPSPSFVFITI